MRKGEVGRGKGEGGRGKGEGGRGKEGVKVIIRWYHMVSRVFLTHSSHTQAWKHTCMHEYTCSYMWTYIHIDICVYTPAYVDRQL